MSGTPQARMRVFTRFLSTAFLLENALAQASPQAPVCIHRGSKCHDYPCSSLSYTIKQKHEWKKRRFNLWLEHKWNYPAARYLKMQSTGWSSFVTWRKHCAFMTRIHLGDTLSTVFPLTFPIHLASAALPQQTLCAILRPCDVHHKGTGLRNLKNNGNERMMAVVRGLPSPDRAF